MCDGECFILNQNDFLEMEDVSGISSLVRYNLGGFEELSFIPRNNIIFLRYDNWRRIDLYLEEYCRKESVRYLRVKSESSVMEREKYFEYVYNMIDRAEKAVSLLRLY